MRSSVTPPGIWHPDHGFNLSHHRTGLWLTGDICQNIWDFQVRFGPGHYHDVHGVHSHDGPLKRFCSGEIHLPMT